MNKNKSDNMQKSRNESMKDHSDYSRDSEHGYMEQGNPAEVHAKARALRNNDNGSHL